MILKIKALRLTSKKRVAVGKFENGSIYIQLKSPVRKSDRDKPMEFFAPYVDVKKTVVTTELSLQRKTAEALYILLGEQLKEPRP